jgi:DNA-binding transcriptional ArsR family regulator
MIVTIRLTPEDLLNLRFAYSPLVELSASFEVLISPAKQAPYRRWVEESYRALDGLELPYLSALIPGRYYIPDFLTPTPTGTHFTLEDEIQRMLALPDEMIQANIQTLIALDGDSQIRQDFLIYPREMRLCLAEELRVYWQRTLASHWSYVSGILEGDVLYRARQLALAGVNGVFEDLHPRLLYRPGELQLMKPHHPGRDREHTLSGAGLHFVPAIFACTSLMWQIVPEWQPMIVYAPRGLGQWKQTPPEPDQSLEIALGTGRARVLTGLGMPHTTTELARLLDLTSGAVSQHLSRLHDAKLVEPHRSGKRVYYRLTPRGERLLDLFGGV